MMSLCLLATMAVCRFGSDACAIFFAVMFLLGGFVCSIPFTREKQYAVATVWSGMTLAGTIAIACV
jgi:hypothetical protein